MSDWFTVIGKKQRNNGFTLVETLVAIGVIAILGIILSQVFYTSLRGGNKAQLIALIKQNGGSALSSMDFTIRNSDQVVSTCALGTMVVTGGVYTRYRICPEGSINCPTGNGKILVDHPTLTPQDTSTQTQLTYLCDTGIQTSPSSLTDDNINSGVSVQSGSFQRSQLPGYKDSVVISFVIKPGVSAPASIAAQVSPVTFTTTVNLR